MKTILYLFALLFLFMSCSNTVKGDSKTQAEDSVTILRLDKDIFQYIQNPTEEIKQNVLKKYPTLIPALGQVIVTKRIENDTTNFFSSIEQYYSHPALSQIYKDALAKFDNMTPLQTNLSKIETLMKEYFPNKTMPKLALHISGFKENVMVVDGIISLSSDKYMGSNYPGYQQFFSPTERTQMESHLIARDFLKAWIISDRLIEEDDKKNLLSAMVEEGKSLYLLSNLLPEYSKEDLISYTKEQLEWCDSNKKKIWQTTVKQNNLFSTDNLTIVKYMNNAQPSPISTEAPEQIGAWIGWQIVEKYAQKTGAPISDILNKDAATILKESKYNP